MAEAAPGVDPAGPEAAGLDPAVVAEVRRRLAGIADEHGIRVAWAVESGSRAWGFPSPDSDHDCRFLYVRPTADYLDPWPARDVIELPVDATYDLNGWDLVKAVRLAVRGNATMAEWLRSPIVYGGDAVFRDRLLALWEDVADPLAVVAHYRHLGLLHWDRARPAHPDDPVRLKPVFYALRPAAVLHWMAEHGRHVAPMDLGRLLREAPPAPEVAEAVAGLVALKARTRELGVAPVPRAVIEFVDGQLGGAVAPVTPARGLGPPGEDARRRAAAAFRELLAHHAPPGPAPQA